MPGKKKSDYAPHIEPQRAPACNVAGCGEPGTYKAPKSREELHEYQWFCLDHVREHNKHWDYFEGLDAQDILDFQKDAVTGHRPTWNRESRLQFSYSRLQDALYEFLNPHVKKQAPVTPHLPGKVRKALSTLDMVYPVTLAELKTQYRVLVKKHHPDVNKGNKQSEETFKRITAAYHTLSEHLKNAS